MTGEPTYSPALDKVLSQVPPPRLYHYTSATALMNIIKTREVWASNLWYVNDAKELTHSVDCVQLFVDGFIHAVRQSEWKARMVRGHFDEDEDFLTPRQHQEHAFLGSLPGAAIAAIRPVYAFALSEKEDLLSQWRAYCPPAGGYSIGFPSDQLQSMAGKQGFRLVKCIYDRETQFAIMEDWVTEFRLRYSGRIDAGQDDERATLEVGSEFSRHVARYGAILKHPAFAEEQEWRLVSDPDLIDHTHPQVDFRVGGGGLVPFFRFRLSDEQYPDLTRAGAPGPRRQFVVLVGPTNNTLAAREAVGNLLVKHLPGAYVGASSIPYRSFAG